MAPGIREIVVIATGGTIAMGSSAPGAGARPAYSGSELLSGLPALPNSGIRIEVVNLFNAPSAHFSLADLWAIAERIRGLAAEGPGRAFVVTMGTDILEEAAYFLDLIAGRHAPIVLTGAMRSVDQPGYEGRANLYHALLTAAAPDSATAGTLVVMNEEIHAARDVQKTHATNPAAFSSPGWGPLGWIVENRAWVRRRPAGRETIAAVPPFPQVELIRFAAGMSPFLIDKSVEGAVGGLVLEASGVGHVSPAVADALERAVAVGIPVVATSRCLTGATLTRTYGFTGSESDLCRRGVIMARGQTGLKARIRLACALAAGEDAAAVRRRFEADTLPPDTGPDAGPDTQLDKEQR